MLDIVRLAPSATAGEAPQLPRNIEAEAAFLGAILIDNRVVEDLPVALTPDHFFEPLHGRIFQQTMALIERKAFRGSEFLLTLRLESGERVLAHVPSHHDHAIGEAIGIRLDIDHVVAFRAGAGRAQAERD